MTLFTIYNKNINNCNTDNLGSYKCSEVESVFGSLVYHLKEDGVKVVKETRDEFTYEKNGESFRIFFAA